MKKLCFGALLVVLISCGEKLLEKPEDLIPRDEMISILKDMNLINSAKNMNVSILHDNDVDPIALVFKKYGIDSLQFVNSDRYYASMIDEYEAMYKELEGQLEEEKNALSEAKRIKDSIRAHKKLNRSPVNKINKKKINDSLQ